MRALVVRDVMTKSVVTVAPNLGYKQLADLLVEMGVSAVPVVDDDGRVLGVVSEADLLQKVADVRPGLFHRAAGRKAAGETAAELMTSPAVTVAATATLTAAARLMEEHRVKRLPVLGEHGGVVGIVARRDLLRRYLRADEDIRADVIDGVLRGVLWLDPMEVEVVVADGHVTLTGRVDRRSTAQIAARLVRVLDGVVGLTEELEWGFDDTTLARRYSMNA